MSRAAERGGPVSPGSIAPALEAIVLFSVYSLGYPWFFGWLGQRLPQRPGSWLVIEASTLVLVGLMVGAFGWRTRAGVTPRGIGIGWRDRCAVASSALLLLGMVALVLRLVDPAFDDQELGLRSLNTHALLIEFLLLLPFSTTAEELVFRACQRRLRCHLGRGPTVMAVGLAFALFHWAPGTALDRHAIETLLATFVGGMVLAAAFERAPSVRLLVAVHCAYDYLAVGQAWLDVGHQRAFEAILFASWIGVTGLVAWRMRRRIEGGWIPTEPAPGDPPARAVRVIGEWCAAVAYGGGLPVVIGLIRLFVG